jgi:hypothetical protein
VKVALVTLDAKAGATLSIADTTASTDPNATMASQPRPSLKRTRLVEMPL